jgi:hypothetical protein
MELDQLELIDTATSAPPKKLTKAQRIAEVEWQRSMAVRQAFLRMDLDSVCREYTLSEIFHRWHEVRAAEAKYKQEMEARRKRTVPGGTT